MKPRVMQRFFLYFLFSCVRFATMAAATYYAENDSSRMRQNDASTRTTSEFITNNINNNHGDTLEMCYNRFQVQVDTIIRTQDSRMLGAKYINESELPSKEDCFLWCCHVTDCNVAVFEEKDKGSCYLFDCGPPVDFKCKFTSHYKYTSAVLTTRGANKDMTEASGNPADEHIVALKSLRNQAVPKSQPPPDNVASAAATVASEKKSSPEQEQHTAAAINVATTGPTQQNRVTFAPVASLGKPNAANVPCSHFQFQCRNSGECIAIYNACDGIAQCSDGSDESADLGCPPDRRFMAQTTRFPPPKTSGGVERGHQTESEAAHQMEQHSSYPLTKSNQQQTKSVQPVEPVQEVRVSEQKGLMTHTDDTVSEHQRNVHYVVGSNKDLGSPSENAETKDQISVQSQHEAYPGAGTDHHRHHGHNQDRESLVGQSHEDGVRGYDQKQQQQQQQHGSSSFHRQDMLKSNAQQNYPNQYNNPMNQQLAKEDPPRQYEVGNENHKNAEGSTRPINQMQNYHEMHSDRQHYENRPVSYNSEHGNEDRLYNSHYGGPGNGNYREFYEGAGYNENEYTNSYQQQQEGQYLERKQNVPLYRPPPPQSAHDSETSTNHEWHQNNYNTRPQTHEGSRKYPDPEMDIRYQQHRTQLGPKSQEEEIPQHQKASEQRNVLQQGYRNELPEREAYSPNGQSSGGRMWSESTYDQTERGQFDNSRQQQLAPPKRPEIHHEPEYDDHHQSPPKPQDVAVEELKHSSQQTGQTDQQQSRNTAVSPQSGREEHATSSDAGSTGVVVNYSVAAAATHPPKLVVASKPQAHISQIKLSLVEAERAERTSESSGAILALTLGMSITGLLLVLVGCRLRMVRRRLLRGRSPYAHDADYLVNGMYL